MKKLLFLLSILIIQMSFGNEVLGPDHVSGYKMSVETIIRIQKKPEISMMLNKTYIEELNKIAAQDDYLYTFVKNNGYSFSEYDQEENRKAYMAIRDILANYQYDKAVLQSEEESCSFSEMKAEMLKQMLGANALSLEDYLNQLLYVKEYIRKFNIFGALYNTAVINSQPEYMREFVADTRRRWIDEKRIFLDMVDSEIVHLRYIAQDYNKLVTKCSSGIIPKEEALSGFNNYFAEIISKDSESEKGYVEVKRTDTGYTLTEVENIPELGLVRRSRAVSLNVGPDVSTSYDIRYVYDVDVSTEENNIEYSFKK